MSAREQGPPRSGIGLATHPARITAREKRGDEMKRFAIATLLAVLALGGVGTAWAFNDDTPLTGPDSIQAP